MSAKQTSWETLDRRYSLPQTTIMMNQSMRITNEQSRVEEKSYRHWQPFF